MRSDEAERTRLLLRQGAAKAARRGAPEPGRFLTAADSALAAHEAKEAGVAVCFDGGWPEAERRQVCFAPQGVEMLFTAVWVRITWDRRFSAVTHRDLLGSLMGLGIDRSYTGDLVMQEDGAWLFALPELAKRLPDEWREAGRTPIRAELTDTRPSLKPPEGRLVRDTVASLRLDCVLAAGLGISRARAAELIRSGRAEVDHRMEDRIDYELWEGSLLSIRGQGRIRLVSAEGRNRHDRIPVVLERFLKE